MTLAVADLSRDGLAKLVLTQIGTTPTGLLHPWFQVTSFACSKIDGQVAAVTWCKRTLSWMFRWMLEVWKAMLLWVAVQPLYTGLHTIDALYQPDVTLHDMYYRKVEVDLPLYHGQHPYTQAVLSRRHSLVPSFMRDDRFTLVGAMLCFVG